MKDIILQVAENYLKEFMKKNDLATLENAWQYAQDNNITNFFESVNKIYEEDYSVAKYNKLTNKTKEEYINEEFNIVNEKLKNRK